MKWKNIYLKMLIINKANINLCFFNNQVNFFFNLYVLNFDYEFNLRFMKKYVYENGIKNLLINTNYKVGLKYDFITKLVTS